MAITIDVYHIAGIDSGSSCERFTDCLAEIRAWSDRRPCHLPLIVWVEPKSETGGDSLADPSVIDRDILSIFPPDRLLRPDDVRGDSLRFPNDAPFRCNPVTGADTCREDDLDENWTVVSHGGPG